MKRMKCKTCAEIWIVEDKDLKKQKVCPYCVTSIQEEAEFSEYDTLEKAIYGAILKMGKDILQNPRQLSGLMMDIAPNLKKEIRIFAKSINEDYVNDIKNAFEQDLENAVIIINKLQRLFMEEEGLSDSWAGMLCAGLYGAILYTKGMGITRLVNVEIEDFNVYLEEKKMENSIICGETKWEY